jgi:hypothetical protein
MNQSRFGGCDENTLDFGPLESSRQRFGSSLQILRLKRIVNSH